MRNALSLMLVLGTSVMCVVGAESTVPPRSAAGQTLVVPQEQLALGDVYHVIPGRDTQVIMQADAPLLRLAAVCNRVIGYVVAPFDFEEGQPPVLAGALRIPVASLRCGLDEQDQALHGPERLDAAKYPEITARLLKLTDVRLESEERGRRVYTLQATGTLTVKDKTTEISAPVRLTFTPFTWQTMERDLGDTLVVRTRFDVPADALGLAPPERAPRDLQPETLTLDVFLMCSPVSPERNLDPRVKRQQHERLLGVLTRLRDFNDPDGAYAAGRAYMQEIWNDGPALGRLGWAVLAEPGIERRNLKFAEQVLVRANELTEHQDAECLHALARLHYEREDLEGAVKWARAAVQYVDRLPGWAAEPIREALRQYESATTTERARE